MTNASSGGLGLRDTIMYVPSVCVCVLCLLYAVTIIAPHYIALGNNNFLPNYNNIRTYCTYKPEDVTCGTVASHTNILYQQYTWYTRSRTPGTLGTENWSQIHAIVTRSPLLFQTRSSSYCYHNTRYYVDQDKLCARNNSLSHTQW